MIPGTDSRAAAALADAARAFEACGWRPIDGADPAGQEIALGNGGGLEIVLRHRSEGRFFGGTRALEIASAHALLPRSRGLRAHGAGAIRMARMAFRARHGDPVGRELAARLSRHRALSDALSGVDFESVRVEADGTPVIRHLGGSVVWILVPPMIRTTPLKAEQARRVADALRAFASAGREAR